MLAGLRIGPSCPVVGPLPETIKDAKRREKEANRGEKGGLSEPWKKLVQLNYFIE